MVIISIISLFFLLIYLSIFAYFIYGFIKNKDENSTKESLAISVIIPFRNEEENLQSLIYSLKELNYNLNIVEFIFVDDHSTDNSYETISQELKKTTLIYKIIKQPDSKKGKKRAIISGVTNAKNNWIVTTDADSIPNKNWLIHYSNAFQNKYEFVIGPVINKTSNNFIGKLQNIEAMLLVGTSLGSASNKNPIICSGANLGYSKSLFEGITPYKDNLHLSSGDDLFFLDHVLLAKKKVDYLKHKSAVVLTKSPETYKKVINQAIRWSSKNRELKNKASFYLSILVFGVNMLLLVNLISLSLGAQFSALFLIFKFSIDFLFLTIVASHFNQNKLILLSPFIYLLYPIHLLIIFVSSFFVSVKWKERAIINNEK